MDNGEGNNSEPVSIDQSFAQQFSANVTQAEGGESAEVAKNDAEKPAVETEAPKVEEQVETPELKSPSENDQSGQTESQEPSTTDSQKSETEASGIDYGESIKTLIENPSLTEDQKAAVRDLMEKSVPMPEFTRMRQKDKQVLHDKDAEISRMQNELEYNKSLFSERVKRADDYETVMEALRNNPEAQELIRQQLDSQSQNHFVQKPSIDPALAKEIDEIKSLRSQLLQQHGDQLLNNFTQNKEDLDKGSYTRIKFDEFLSHTISSTATVQEAMELAYSMAQNAVQKQREAARTPAINKVREIQKQQAAMSSGGRIVPKSPIAANDFQSKFEEDFKNSFNRSSLSDLSTN